MTEAVTTAADLSPSHRSLFDKAVSSVRMQNASYAVQLLLPVVKDVPSFLEGRKTLRQAAALVNAGKKKLIDTSSLSVMKLKSKVDKDPVGVLYDIEEILATDPFSVAANQLLFDAANAAKMPQTAAFALEMIMKGHPTNIKVMHKLAEFYLSQDDPEGAITVYNNILKVDNSDGDARKGVTNANARLSMKKQKWEGGDGGNFRDLIKNKDKAKQLEDLARVGATKEQMQEQLAYLGAEYEADPNNVDNSRRIGELYERMDDYASALSYFQWALQLSNGDASLETKVHKLQDRMDEQTIATLQATIDADPTAESAEAAREQLKELQHARIEKLVISSRERVERNPTDPQLRFELGTNLFNAGHPTEAIPELQRAKGNPAIRTKAMLALARCYEAKNMLDLGVRQLQEAAGEIPTMDIVKKEVLYVLGNILEKMGRKDEFLDAFKQIYEVDYGYRDVASRVEGSY
ncbi:MAG: Tetratricopeptide repeat-containing protein [Verrucomicrobiales bacterium]|nr:Tetratricopeptide repeat-containing protein [Verrucomicrobiales bacterium]